MFEIIDIIKIAKKAGDAILKIYSKNTDSFKVSYKEDNSPLTIADKASNDIICTELYKLSPSIPILSEEGKHIKFEDRKKWGKFWLIDPLDGTKEFINRNGEFTVNIALIESSKPILEKKLSSSCEEAAVWVSLEPINPNLYGLKPFACSILIPSSKASRT